MARAGSYGGRLSYPQVLSEIEFRSRWFVLALLIVMFTTAGAAQSTDPRFRVIALAEAGGIHRPFVDAAKTWLEKLASENRFSIDYIENTDKINDAFLSH